MSALPSQAVYHRYQAEKRAWLAQHPNATAKEIEAASQAIAQRLGL